MPPLFAILPRKQGLIGGGKGTVIVNKSCNKALFSEGGGTHDMCGIGLVLFLVRI